MPVPHPSSPNITAGGQSAFLSSVPQIFSSQSAATSTITSFTENGWSNGSNIGRSLSAVSPRVYASNSTRCASIALFKLNRSGPSRCNTTENIPSGSWFGWTPNCIPRALFGSFDKAALNIVLASSIWDSRMDVSVERYIVRSSCKTYASGSPKGRNTKSSYRSRYELWSTQKKTSKGRAVGGSRKCFSGVAYSEPIFTARSPMRVEKPHSLSYQASTRTRRPPMTLVWSAAKIELSSVWLKSVETSFSSV